MLNKENAIDFETIDFIVVISLYKDYINLHSTLNSIKAQKNANRICTIIVEKPSSLEYSNLISTYSDMNIIHIYEEDCGIYDAWNKALKYFNKQWIIFLGAGDTLYDEELLIKIQSIINKNPHINIIYGNEFIDKKINRINKLLALIKLNYKMCIPHSATIHKSSIFKIQFNSNYKICGDYDLLCRIKLKYRNIYHYDSIITKSMGNGISSQHKEIAYREYILINYRNRRVMGTIYSVFLYLGKQAKDYFLTYCKKFRR